MKFSDVKGLSTTEAIKKKREVRSKLFEAKMKNALGQLTNPLEIRTMRRDIAKLNMVISQNQAGAKQ